LENISEENRLGEKKHAEWIFGSIKHPAQNSDLHNGSNNDILVKEELTDRDMSHFHLPQIEIFIIYQSPS
jgi:hypothetical protein